MSRDLKVVIAIVAMMMLLSMGVGLGFWVISSGSSAGIRLMIDAMFILLIMRERIDEVIWNWWNS